LGQMKRWAIEQGRIAPRINPPFIAAGTRERT